jgi:hypothetical protein
MTDLRPFQPKSSVPLTSGARFIRGFTRIGVFFAVLVVLIGVTVSAISAYSNFNNATKTYQTAQCIAQLARSGYAFKKKQYSEALDYDVAGCYAPYTLEYKSVGQILAIADQPAPTLLTSDATSALGVGLMITGVVAVGTYIIFWCLGWLCAGFTRDS